MFIEARLIDENGFIIDPVIVKDSDVLESNLIKIPVPPLLYKPRWTENGWVEGATEEYIKNEDNRTKGTADMDLLKQENTLLKAQIQASSDRSDFHEEIIAEMAMLVYP
ncbi:hypothetical protein AF332_20550 [Sporosarcina globispora]|uniref:Bacteriophage SP-beta YorD domain-containing protein n=1 Tax=Sporosarcina globispora TaxID=1459 RepID=A0A0M0GHL0_SPOGL|nr:hypothetical protein [Sporosarcina globispora]KON88942.1 hypothetical protein AF332_20550 [Sporosarcina globispora]